MLELSKHNKKGLLFIIIIIIIIITIIKYNKKDAVDPGKGPVQPTAFSFGFQ